MFEIIKYYQSLAEKFDSRILTVPGIVVVLVGLCVWLAGLRWRKVLGALAGGSFFAAIGLCLGIYDFPIVIVVAAIGIVIGALVEKIMLGVCGTAMVVAIVLVVVSTSAKQRQGGEVQYDFQRWPQYEESNDVLNSSQASEITEKTGLFICSKIIENIKSSSLVSFGAGGVALVIAGFIALLRPRLFVAAFSSLFGAVMIFAGLIMLLFYKGSKPVNFISEKGQFYAIVLLVMMVFGTVVQMVLSPPAAKPTEKDVPEKGNGAKK